MQLWCGAKILRQFRFQQQKLTVIGEAPNESLSKSQYLEQDKKLSGALQSVFRNESKSSMETGEQHIIYARFGTVDIS